MTYPLPDVEPVPARETDRPALALGIAVCCLPAFARAWNYRTLVLPSSSVRGCSDMGAIAVLIAIASLFWLVPMASNSFDEMED
jgi:hypothetical protein